MKTNPSTSGHFLCILFLMLVFTNSVHGRAFSAIKIQSDDQKIVVNENHPIKKDFANVMGMDMFECGRGDEECITRRDMAEAHLDYIYTQSQNPA